MNNNVIGGNLGYKGDPGVSPILTVSKENGIATIAITDVDGTKSVQLSDGEMTRAMVIDNLTSTLTDQPLSAKQGKILNDELANQGEQINDKMNGTVLYSNESWTPYKDLSAQDCILSEDAFNFPRIKIVYGAKESSPIDSSWIETFDISSVDFFPTMFTHGYPASGDEMRANIVLNLKTEKIVVDPDGIYPGLTQGTNDLNATCSFYTNALNQTYYRLFNYTLNGTYVSSMDSCPIIIYKIIGYDY